MFKFDLVRLKRTTKWLTMAISSLEEDRVRVPGHGDLQDGAFAPSKNGGESVHSGLI